MFSYNLQGFTESPDETVQPTDNSRCNISRYTVLNVVESGGSSFGSDQNPIATKLLLHTMKSGRVSAAASHFRGIEEGAVMVLQSSQILYPAWSLCHHGVGFIESQMNRHIPSG